MKTIRVTVHFTGPVDIKKIKSGTSMSIPADTTASELLTLLDISEPHKKYVMVMVADQKQDLSYRLKDNDEVRLWLLIGGG
ncbi:MAG TPA: hypothetical protein PK876_03655 [Elusimicrobiota bacterium]|nr:hypothetical protein [Elusimicrobiota bacterium]